MANINKKYLILAIFILVFGLGLVGCGKQPAVNQNVDVNTNINSDEIDTSDLPSEDLSQEGWQTYRNEEYGFEIKYPSSWVEDEINKEKISFYNKDRSAERDPFKKELIWPELNVYYYDDFDNTDELIKNIFNLNNYLTNADAVEKEIDLVKYDQYDLNGKKIYRLEVAGEMSMTYYFLPSNVKKRSFIALSFPYNNKGLERLILSTIQF